MTYPDPDHAQPLPQTPPAPATGHPTSPGSPPPTPPPVGHPVSPYPGSPYPSGPYPTSPYPPPYPAAPVFAQPARPVSGLAVASLVLGIIGVVVGWCTVTVPSIVAVIFSAPGILAIIFGHLAMPQTRTGQLGGQGMTVAGLVLGYLAVALTVILMIFAFIDAATSPFTWWF